MYVSLLDFLFVGCSHNRLGWPISPRLGRDPMPRAAAETGTYCCCLECGREFPFSVDEWRVIKPREVRRREAAKREAMA